MATVAGLVGTGLAAVGGGSAAAGAGLVASAALAAGGTALSLQQQRRAQRAQERADAVGSAQTEIQNQRAIRQNLIRSRAQQAQLQSAGVAQTGSVGGGSAIQGSLGSAQTQAGANIGFARQTQAASSAINRQVTRGNRAASNAATFGAVANLPNQFGVGFGDLLANRGS